MLRNRQKKLHQEGYLLDRNPKVKVNKTDAEKSK